MLYILTGNGKGKTTSALGMAVRAAGGGKKTVLIQFLKSGGYGEIKALGMVKNIQVSSFGRSCFVLPVKEIKRRPELAKLKVQAINDQDLALAQQGWDQAIQAFRDKQVKLVILDEINVVLKYQMLNLEKVQAVLEKYSRTKDIVLTGRYCPKALLTKADLVTEMKEIKHPYQKGLPQRRGIEF